MKNGVVNLIALITHASFIALYLILLYNTEIPQLYLKGTLYLFMATMHVYLVGDEWSGVSTFKQWQYNTINKLLFVFNFTLIAATIFDICDGVIMMIWFCVWLAITYTFFLYSGIRRGYFKQ